jgi:hypothetical protein
MENVAAEAEAGYGLGLLELAAQDTHAGLRQLQESMRLHLDAGHTHCRCTGRSRDRSTRGCAPPTESRHESRDFNSGCR